MHGPHQLAQKLTMTGLPAQVGQAHGPPVDGRAAERRSGLSPTITPTLALGPDGPQAATRRAMTRDSGGAAVGAVCAWPGRLT